MHELFLLHENNTDGFLLKNTPVIPASKSLENQWVKRCILDWYVQKNQVHEKPKLATLDAFATEKNVSHNVRDSVSFSNPNF